MLPSGRSLESFSTGYVPASEPTLQLKMTKPNLGTRNAQEADRHEHTIDCDLVVAELDAVQVLYTQTIRRDETIESKDLVHLDGRDQGAAALANDVRD